MTDLSDNDAAWAVDVAATEMGFQPKRANWYQASEDTISVLGLQRSQYGKFYYLNFGVLLRPLDSTLFPKPTNCHIANRVDALAGDDAPGFRDALNLEIAISRDERLSTIRKVFAADLLPWLHRFHSVADIRATTVPLRGFAVTRVARSFLDDDSK